ncbi:hypothetical protein BDC45DRAFT_519874, partial [Circinella umbellata]
MVKKIMWIFGYLSVCIIIVFQKSVYVMSSELVMTTQLTNDLNFFVVAVTHPYVCINKNIFGPVFVAVVVMETIIEILLIITATTAATIVTKTL